MVILYENYKTRQVHQTTPNMQSHTVKTLYTDTLYNSKTL